MSLYLDTSCLLKLVLVEPESERVRELAEAEPEVVVSSLARFEAVQNLLALRLGGEINRAQHQRCVAKFEELLRTAPLKVVAFPYGAVELADKHHLREPYCRTLDRLHLGAMEALGLRRLFTNDDQQADAAHALGFEVVLPR